MYCTIISSNSNSPIFIKKEATQKWLYSVRIFDTYLRLVYDNGRFDFLKNCKNKTKEIIAAPSD